MGNKSRKPPKRNDAVEVFTRDIKSTTGLESSSGPVKDEKNGCWSFHLIDLKVSLNDIRLNDPVRAEVSNSEVVIYNENEKRIGKAPQEKGLQISKIAEAENRFTLYGNVTEKANEKVVVRVCFE